MQAQTILLNNGVQMPLLGFGVWQIADGQEVINSVEGAINAGYKHIDTARIYKNETGVGQAIAQSALARDELFITTKVWNADQGYDNTLAAFEQSMDKLQLAVLDLYLIHWPLPMIGKYKETWRALETLYKQGRVRAIGVSNFDTEHLDDLMADCDVAPMVNQVECHPYFQQQALLTYCQAHHIVMTAWSPLGQGKLLDDPVLIEIAKKHHKTTAQVILRWNIERGVVVIPKSTNAQRIIDNANIYDFQLTTDQQAAIAALDKATGRIGPEPKTMSRVE